MFAKTIQHLGVLLTLTAAALTCASAEAQFGGGDGGFGGGGVGGPGLGVGSVPEGTVASVNIVIVPSKSQKSVSGYSAAIGEWDRVEIEPHPKLGITPIVSADIAVVPGKRHLHAFGGKTGKWASLELDDGVDTSSVVVGQKHASFLTETHFHIFSSASGKWASLDLTKD